MATTGMEITTTYQDIGEELSLNKSDTYLVQNVGDSEILFAESVAAPEDDDTVHILTEEAAARIKIPLNNLKVWMKVEAGTSSIAVTLI